MNLKNIILLSAILLAGQIVFAQISPQDELFKALKSADSLVFEQGFNKCDIAALEQAMHKNLEFLHDKSGAQTREEFFKGFKENICSNTNFKPIRKLVEGSLQVYLMMDNGELYGAIQMGEHKFYISEPNKELRHTSSAKFIHTWLLEDGRWQLFRVLSYDHQEPK